MKNKSLFLKDLFLVITTGLLTIFSLVLYITSYSSYDDGFGYDNSFDKDSLILLIISLILLAYSVYILVMNLKETKRNQNVYYAISFSVGLICFAYPLGRFFKKLNGDDFDYSSYQSYLYVGIVALAFTLYIVFSYLHYKKNNNVE